MVNPLNFDLPISGMTCASCAGRVERALNKVPGVKTVSVNLANEHAHIETNGEPDSATLIAAVTKAGYGATVAQDPALTADQQHKRLSRERWALIFAIALALPLILPMLLQPLGVPGPAAGR